MITSDGSIRVAVIDDHIQIHQIISTLLRTTGDIQLVAHGANGQEAIELCAQIKIDIMLMDVLMPVMDGIRATQMIHELFPSVKVLLLSGFQDHESMNSMIHNGAVGFLSKSTLSQDLPEIIRVTFQGKVVFSSDIISDFAFFRKCSSKFHLTDREMEILQLLAKGLTMPQMAASLAISQSTAKFHTENICRKLSVRTRSEALVLAAKNHLV
jgi:NarL family two-component system response regulator LiaR